MRKLSFSSLSFNAQNTPISTQFDDIYFSTQDGLAESYYVFQGGNQLWEKWHKHEREDFIIAETGFGTGLNFLAVAEKFQQFLQENPQHVLKRLYFCSFEKYPLTAQDLATIHQHYPQFATLSQNLTACWQPRQEGCQRYHFAHLYLDIWFGDIGDNFAKWGDSYNNLVDAWFLDGFSPEKNPEMWNENIYAQMYRTTRNGGSFATFTAASAVRKGLQAVGFEVYKRKGFAKKREMLWGEKRAETTCDSPAFPYYYQPSSKESNDIAIVGGGVASLFVALSLLERGKQVTLYCQDAQLAQNASGNLQGAIYPQLSDDDERNIRFYIHAFDYALQRLKQLAAKVEFQYGLTGVALYAYNEKTAQKLQKMASLVNDEQLFQLCSAAELSEKVGLPLNEGGAFIAEGGWLSPVEFVQRSFAYLQHLGLKVVLNHQVKAPTFQQGKWCWQHNGETFAHDILILANGHTLSQFAQAEGIPLYPVRGQVSCIATNPDLAKLKCVLCYDGYITPMSAQQTHCIGASHIRDNDNMAFSLAEHQENLAKLQQNLTACEWTKSIDLSMSSAKVGIRAALRDRIPMVGIMPNFAEQKSQYQNLYNLRRRKAPIEKAAAFRQLYLVNGLASRGLTSAPLLGELLASLITQEPIPISEDIWQALNPNRSWLRKLLKGSQID